MQHHHKRVSLQLNHAACLDILTKNIGWDTTLHLVAVTQKKSYLCKETSDHIQQLTKCFLDTTDEEILYATLHMISGLCQQPELVPYITQLTPYFEGKATLLLCVNQPLHAKSKVLEKLKSLQADPYLHLKDHTDIHLIVAEILVKLHKIPGYTRLICDPERAVRIMDSYMLPKLGL